MDIARFHLNEGHASLLTVELLDEERKKANRSAVTTEDVEAVRRQCIFTTHTPVVAGHDQGDLGKRSLSRMTPTPSFLLQ
jgi:glycogen phosphorylase